MFYFTAQNVLKSARLLASRKCNIGIIASRLISGGLSLYIEQAIPGRN